jgi:hypothetical protein
MAATEAWRSVYEDIPQNEYVTKTRPRERGGGRGDPEDGTCTCTPAAPCDSPSVCINRGMSQVREINITA